MAQSNVTLNSSIEVISSGLESDPKNFILDHQYLAKQETDLERAPDPRNIVWLEFDLRNGELSKYVGEFVAYHKGVLCGESNNGELLYDTASNYYGKTNLTVFKVPQNGEKLDLEKVLGEKDFL